MHKDKDCHSKFLKSTPCTHAVASPRVGSHCVLDVNEIRFALNCNEPYTPVIHGIKSSNFINPHLGHAK